MSEQDFVAAVESSQPPEVQARAEELGWIPPSRFHGDPDRFVDADIYIKRGEEVLPIVREQNKRLHTELNALKSEAAATKAALKAAQTAIESIEERHSVATQKAVEDARRQLKTQLSAASEAGDHDGVAELTDQLVTLNSAEKVARTAPLVQQPPQEFVAPPDLTEWNKDNPWFGTNKRKTALALGIAQELREAGETATGRTFFDKVTAEVDKELGAQQPRGDKVEGARSSGESGSAGNGKKGYASMPADARAACDADAKRFVGEGKKYKTPQEWRNRYAEIYFAE
jgi:hypothetical protein